MLLSLSDEQLAETLTAVAALALEPETLPDTPTARALDQSVGRWTRRKLRKTLEGVTLERVAEIDFAAWRSELEILASAVALDRCDGDLRTALLALLLEAQREPLAEVTESTDLSAAIAASPVA